MAAGDLLTAPGQIEWDAQLIGFHPDGGLWIGRDSDVSEGWQVRWTAKDLETDAGASPGVPVVQAMYPTIIGLHIESPALLATFEASMTPGATGTLCWWDWGRDVKYTAAAVARRCELSNAKGAQVLPHRDVDCMWMIPRPLDITTLP